jgi:hypothetical protein
MALRWIEGFEIDQSGTYYDRKYAEAAGLNNFLTGRLHGKCLSTSISTEFRPASFGVQNTWILGFGFQHAGASVEDLSDIYIAFRRGAEENLRLQFVQDTSTTFKIQVKRGSTVLDTSAAYSAEQWHWFEFKALLDPAAGTYELRHNESTDVSDTGVNTAESGTAGADIIDFQLRYAGLYLDDLFLCDGSGSNNNDFLGDCVIEGRLPTGDGTTTNFTPSAGVDHYAVLDDPAATPNDSDYVSSNTVGHIDLLTFDNLSFITGQVYGVMVHASIGLDSSGSRTMRAKCRSGGSNYNGSSTWTINSTLFKHFTEIFEVDPDTSSLWTIGDVDSAEFGFEVVS